MALNVCANPAQLTSNNPLYLPLTSTTGFSFFDDAPIQSGPCVWANSAAPDPPGLAQTSNAWGNYDASGSSTGDNTLMGCHAILDNTEYTDFLATVTIMTSDDDGIGFTFGYKSSTDYHTAVLMNDQWPSPAADGVHGPFMKMKHRRADRQCVGHMDNSNVCFDTYAYLRGPDTPGATVADPVMPGQPSLPQPAYASQYVNYPVATEREPTAFTLNLVVRGSEARLWFDHRENGHEAVGLRANLPSGTYSGGKIGFFTYAQSGVIFKDLKITDLTQSGLDTAHCGGVATCNTATGLCGPSVGLSPSPPPPAPPPPPPLHTTATCSNTPCNGGNDGCGGNLCLGDGDCDSDSDCATGLMCGMDNCNAFRAAGGWPVDGPGWDTTDDCCYAPGGLGAPTPMTLTFDTCDVQDAQTGGVTILHTSETLFLSGHSRDEHSQRTLVTSTDTARQRPIRFISLTATGSDGWCVENLMADGEPLLGETGVWLDNPVQSTGYGYNNYRAHVSYTWRVQTPRRSIVLSWHTCDTSNAQTHDQVLLHTTESVVMESQSRAQTVTKNVPEGTDAITLTATTSDGWCVENIRLNGQEPNPPQQRGSWLDSPAEGMYSPYPVAVTMQWYWTTVAARPPLVCNYVLGDGTGGTEMGIGMFASREECAAHVYNTQPTANGATYEKEGTGRCYAEFGMSRPNTNYAWYTCLFGGWPPIAPLPPRPPPPTAMSPPRTSGGGGANGGADGGAVFGAVIISLLVGAAMGAGGLYYYQRKRGGAGGFGGGLSRGRAQTTPSFTTTAPISAGGFAFGSKPAGSEGGRVPLAGADSASASSYQAPALPAL